MDKNDLISRSKQLSHAIPVYGKYDDSAEFEAVPANYIKGAPAVDPEELRPRGKNITNMNPVDEFICSECGFRAQDIERYDAEDDVCIEFEVKYCPNCGAKMGG